MTINLKTCIHCYNAAPQGLEKIPLKTFDGNPTLYECKDKVECKKRHDTQKNNINKPIFNLI